MHLAGSMGNLGNHQKQMPPHGQRDPFAFFVRGLGKRNRQILFHGSSPQLQHMPREPAEPIAYRRWHAQRQRLHNADQQPHHQVHGVIENQLPTHREGSFLGAAIVAEKRAPRKYRFSSRRATLSGEHDTPPPRLTSATPPTSPLCPSSPICKSPE